MRKAVFLDRDGVLTLSRVIDGKPFAPNAYEDFEVLPEAKGAMKKLKAAGYFLVVVTNQPDVARGAMKIEVLERMHRELREALPELDEIRSCVHDDVDGCHCRKPLPGMLLDSARQWGIDLAQSYMVGDRWRDISTGQAAGCRTVWIDRGYKEKSPETYDLRAQGVADAARLILENPQA